METARLPERLLKRKSRILKDVKPGEEIVIPFPFLKIDPERRCYLTPDAEETRLPAAVRVRRDEQGQFHVDIPENLRFEPAEPPNKAELLPVASITVVSLKNLKWQDPSPI